MSYDVGLYVKLAQPKERWFLAYEPEFCSPTYNYGPMFRACMDWDYDMDVAYDCEFVLAKLEKGVQELVQKPAKYMKYEPENHWGTYDGAIRVLDAFRKEILNFSKENHMELKDFYFSWGDRRFDNVEVS